MTLTSLNVAFSTVSVRLKSFRPAAIEAKRMRASIEGTMDRGSAARQTVSLTPFSLFVFFVFRCFVLESM